MKRIVICVIVLCFLCGCSNIDLPNDIFDENSSKIIVSSDASSHVTKEQQKGIVVQNIDKFGVNYTAEYSKSLIFPAVSGLSPIDSSKKWYYSYLPDKLKSGYLKLCEGAERMADGFINLGKITAKEARLLFCAVKLDHPEYFWLSSKYVICESSGNYLIAFKYIKESVASDYLVTPSERNAMAAKLKSKIAEYLKGLSGKSDYEKEKIIHDRLLSNVTYNAGASKNYDKYPNSYNAYGALVEGTGVCEAYAKAMQLLLNEAGVECILVNGSSEGDGHMWNLVKIHGYWYHLDPTWDDSDDYLNYAYFNLSDGCIEDTHIIDKDYDLYDVLGDNESFNYNLPKASTMEYSYFSVNNTLITSKESAYTTILNAVIEACNNGKVRQDFGYTAGFLNKYKSGSEMESKLHLKQLFYDVSKKVGTKIRLQNIIINYNKNFILIWQ